MHPPWRASGAAYASNMRSYYGLDDTIRLHSESTATGTNSTAGSIVRIYCETCGRIGPWHHDQAKADLDADEHEKECPGYQR